MSDADRVKKLDEERILVLAPTAADAALTYTHLTEAGLRCQICPTLEAMCLEIYKGAGAILLTEEILAEDYSACIAEALSMQPHWSDMPILLLTASGADSLVAVKALDLLGNVTLLERPVRLTTLVSGLRAALRARRRQYEVRSQFERLQKQGERLRLLWETAAVLLSTEEPHAMLRGLFDKIAPHFGLDAYLNLMTTSTGEALKLESFYGISDQAAEALTLQQAEKFSGGADVDCPSSIVTSSQPFSDAAHSQILKSEGIEIFVCNSLRAADRLLGTIAFASRSRDQFDPDELEFFQTVCHYVAYAYERLRLIGQLREEDEKKDEFLATLAHELRNPLAPLRNAAMYFRLRGPSDVDLQNARDIIDRQVQQMTRLVDDLLDISRITRGRIVLQKEHVSLGSAVSNAIESSRPLIDEAGHEFTVHLPQEPLFVYGDTCRLAQVFGNLLTNAAKYTDRGGRIVLTVEAQGDEAIITVADTGIGIATEYLPRVFEMFSQVDPALERSQGGLGIGLALVRRLVEMHGGQVEAHSRGLRQGSEFVVRLPLVPASEIESHAHAHEPAHEPARAEPSGNGSDSNGKPATHRIVVADDNVDAARTLTMLLSLLGHEVRTAFDGVDALELAESFRPDVMLIDIGMPKMNGYDAARAIRIRPWGAGLMLVALTGWGQEDDKRRAKEAGFDHHFTKPVDLAKLKNLLL